MQIQKYYGINVLIGSFTWQEWQDNAGWKSCSADDYFPETSVLSRLKSIVSAEEITFLFFSASWCPDSKPEMPRLYKLFSIMDISFEKIQLVGLDMQKKEPSGLAMEYNIDRVPTLVVLKSGKEIGRIVEHPVKSWEEDLLNIL